MLKAHGSWGIQGYYHVKHKAAARRSVNQRDSQQAPPPTVSSLMACLTRDGQAPFRWVMALIKELPVFGK